MQMHWLTFIVLFSVVAVSSTVRVNQCGGARLLWNEGQLGELCETNLHGECPFGRLACISENAIQCTPQCDITLQDILVSASTNLTCENNGTLTCSCHLGYSGARCETLDLCAAVDCSNNGHCERGVCVCNTGFSGDRCQTNLNCADRGFSWDGHTCSCALGYVGPLCSQCDPFLLCLPKNTSGDFTTARIEDESIIDELLGAAKLPYYSHKPYRPVAQSPNGCACKSSSTSLLIEQYDDDDNDSLFIHHYYQSTRQTTSSWPWVIFGFTIVIIVCISFCILESSRRSPQSYQQPRPTPISLRRDNYPIKMEWKS